MGDLLVIMAQFILKIKLGNDAMQTGSDITRSLNDIVQDIRTNYETIYMKDLVFGKYMKDLVFGKHEHKIRDVNGNVVGSWQVK